ncbi:MAG: VanW family protein [Lachnospiraceae bacterium]|uniref:VanW family protein n=1 Tax=Roseburia hominis TaxID=301301 RepID=UPI001F1C4C0E|nr:VanW family protein [Roseburia hominis]MCI5713766.1 VanW family protein [Lachnospiraceae bacterium]MDD6169703.1 VanW family protein [Lachnospiraceae bacterium]MDY4840118.1 VanW family protein [Lachnospiraceae bacterium]
MKKRQSIGIFLVAVGIIFAAVLLGTGNSVFAKEKDDTLIPGNVYIGEVAVGGMTVEEAKEAVADYVKDITDVDVVLKAGEKSVTVKADELGLTWGNTKVAEEAANIGKSGNLIKRYKDQKDLENENKIYDIVYTVDEEKTRAVLTEKSAELNQKAVNASLKRENGAFIYEDGKQGIVMNIEGSVQSVVSYFNNGWDAKAPEIELVADVEEPEGNKESLSRVKDVLGTYHTDFSSSTAERVINIKNAVDKIDGTVLYPGEEFSVYEAIAPLDAENGYELAGAYENGTTVQSYGGGVCQVSTTLYNAILYAELNVTQRSNHSMLVHYVDPSRDAAIAGTYKDLKFQNSTDAPIYIEGYTSGGIVYFTIYGEETRLSNRKVEYQSETVSQDTPPVQIAAAAAPVGYVAVTQKPNVGQSAKLWKVVTIDGVEQEREVVNTSKYSSSPKIIAVGNVSDDPNACAAINAAIATQDEATVRAVAAQCAAGAAPAAPATTDPAAGATPEAPATTDPAAGVTPEAPATTDPAAGATPEAPVTTDPAAGTTPVQ